MMTQEWLRQFVSYDPETGIMRWIAPYGRGRPGDEVGHTSSNGYRTMCVGKKRYKVHRLAWMYMHGRWPDGETDHINGNRLDNRLRNLREVGPMENQQNKRTPRRDSKTGFLGVCWVPEFKRFRAQIQSNGRGYSLGFYETPEAAHAAYLEAKARLHVGYVPQVASSQQSVGS